MTTTEPELDSFLVAQWIAEGDWTSERSERVAHRLWLAFSEIRRLEDELRQQAKAAARMVNESMAAASTTTVCTASDWRKAMEHAGYVIVQPTEPQEPADRLDALADLMQTMSTRDAVEGIYGATEGLHARIDAEQARIEHGRHPAYEADQLAHGGVCQGCGQTYPEPHLRPCAAWVKPRQP